MLSKQQRLNKNEEEINSQQKDIKKQKRRNWFFIFLNTILTAMFVAICLFSVYRRIDEAVIFDKPADVDSGQTPISLEETTTLPVDENQQAIDGDDANTENKGGNHFTVYSVGNEYIAQKGNGTVTLDVTNVSDSTHDAIISIYISEAELKKHNLSTNGLTDGYWILAKSGLFEPGYKMTSLQLLPLPDKSYLPAGSYSVTMNEKFYNHETGELSQVDSNIPITLEVLN
jgi:hypothetical protein